MSGTIVVTSALWSVLHQQYNVLGILFIFVTGLIFGWMRQRSRSTTLPIVLHTLNNLLVHVPGRHQRRMVELTDCVPMNQPRRTAS